MIDGIRQNLTLIEPGSRKSSKADASKSSSSVEHSTLSAASSAESVEISAPAGSLGGAPIDRAKVEAIRSAIRNNAYPVDFDLLAKRMVESMAGEKA
jgi:flagellar biosynthesis anti-sigma factor FlgM